MKEAQTSDKVNPTMIQMLNKCTANFDVKKPSLAKACVFTVLTFILELLCQDY